MTTVWIDVTLISLVPRPHDRQSGDELTPAVICISLAAAMGWRKWVRRSLTISVRLPGLIAISQPLKRRTPTTFPTSGAARKPMQTCGSQL